MAIRFAYDHQDADLIMLALATHEPYFRVLREDVFANDVAPNACRICGQEGHRAAQCTGTPMEKKKTPTEKKPFIFLDVAILREYLEVELNVSNQPFHSIWNALSTIGFYSSSSSVTTSYRICRHWRFGKVRLTRC